MTKIDHRRYLMALWEREYRSCSYAYWTSSEGKGLVVWLKYFLISYAISTDFLKLLLHCQMYTFFCQLAKLSYFTAKHSFYCQKWLNLAVKNASWQPWFVLLDWTSRDRGRDSQAPFWKVAPVISCMGKAWGKRGKKKQKAPSAL